MQNYESGLKTMARPITEAYARLSDLSVLASLREKINTPEFAEKIEQVPEQYRDTVKSTLQAIKCDKDSLSVSSPLGDITLRITNRQAPSLVQMKADNSPIPVTLTLNLTPNGEQATTLKVIIGAEVNMFMRGMVSAPLSKAAEGLASVLAMV